MRNVIPTIWKSGQSDLLVVEADGLALRAAVCRADSKGQCCILEYCESHAADLSSGLADLCSQLKSVDHPRPSRAILLSPRVQTTILHLPVNPRSPLPFGNMQELVKWELEPYLAQNRVRRIGAILVGRGYLAHADLDRLLSEQNQSSRRSADAGPRRLGELAILSGLLTQGQLDECLALQRSTQDFAGEAACGWAPLDDKPQDGKWKWLACGVTRTYRQHAVDMFKEHGLGLLAIYPLVGCAGASLNGSLGSDDALFEYTGGYLNYTRFSNKKIVTSRSLFTHEESNPMRPCVDFFEGQAERIWLTGRWPDIHLAARELQLQLERPCRAVPLVSDLLPLALPEPSALAGMKGAARHFLGQSAPGCSVCVRAREPKAPLWSNRWVQRALLAVAVTALLAGAAVYLRVLEQAATKQIQLRQTLAARQGEADMLRRRLDELATSIEFMQKTLPQRQRLIPDLLTTVEASCPEEITIRRLAENARGEIILTGWGLSAQEIEAFKIDLQSRLTNLSVGEGTLPVRQERGWHSLSGYAFELRLQPQIAKGRR